MISVSEIIVLHLRGIREVLLAYVVQLHIKVQYILPGYDAFLNLDKEMITRALIIDETSNLRFFQESFGRIYFSYQCNTFKINNTLVYSVLSKIFMHMDAFV